MSLLGFVKKLLIFDVFFGRRSKMYHGIKDGGTAATAIGDPSIARVHNGNSIFNVNDPSIEPFGGHFHSVTPSPELSKVKNFIIGDWVLFGPYYYIDFNHNLGSTIPEVEIWDGAIQTFLQRVEVINSNTIRIFVLSNPDLRFAGSLIVSI